MKKTKILILSHACVTSVNQQFYAEIEKQGNYELTIITPSSWKNDYGNQIVPSRFHEYKGDLVGIPVWKSGSIPLHTYKSSFIDLIKDTNPDFIYVQHEPYAIATFQMYLANTLTKKTPIGFFTWQNINKNYPIPFCFTEQWVLSKTDVMFPGSKSSEDVFRSKGYKGPSLITPASVDTDIYCPQQDSVHLKESWSNSSEFIIGYLGRIVEEKGLKTLLLALKKIEYLPWKLVLVGSGNYESDLEKASEELGISNRILKLGYIPHDQAPLYLSAFDCLVIPSETKSNWKEQFGRVIIESMACGTPVIGSNSGEIPNILTATKGGLIFEEKNFSSLAEQIKKMMLFDDLRLDLSRSGLSSVLSMYTNKNIVEKFLAAVNDAIRKPVMH
jgi:L-malate glycosyltransferase